MKDSFSCRSKLKVGRKVYSIAKLPLLEKRGWKMSRLPFALRILLENLLRREDGSIVRAAEIESLAKWDAKATPSREIAFMPARVLLQDFTGVPAIVDLAAMRDAMGKLGGDPKLINPLQPVELVIDHSVQVDFFGSPKAFDQNAKLEFDRNEERYAFLKWGQNAFENFKVVPPDTGIVHQVNLEFLARGVMTQDDWAFPDTVIGTDSHTTMINGLGVLGWGVGGIEAEAAMLGQPVSMLIPQVVGFRLRGALSEGTTATDLVLTVTQMLRKKGVVGKFVEFFGPGLANLSLADRATIANMAPEYGATCGIFPVDELSLDYLKFSGRPEAQIDLVRAYLEEQGLFANSKTPEAEYSDLLDLDLSTVEPSLAGPKRPQDRVGLSKVKESFDSMVKELGKLKTEKTAGEPERGEVTTLLDGETVTLRNGSVVIGAITSCTNTSNPAVMLAAGLLAKKAVEKGLTAKPWVKTSLAPGSKVVSEYLEEAGLSSYLDKLNFHLVGYGCTTCIGNSGPLPAPIAKAIEEGNLAVASVLSGNRNFEGRVHPQVRANYLASPPLVVAYSIVGRVDIDLTKEPLGMDESGNLVFLKDIWPTQKELDQTIRKAVKSSMFKKSYSDVYEGDASWKKLKVPKGDTFRWDEKSTYVKHPPYFVEMPRQPGKVKDIAGARVLAVFGDSITTDHISPAGSIKPNSPAGKYLISLGVKSEDFNSYGARRGNHEVMMRGTFANVRIKNLMLPGVEGGETVHLPDGARMSIYDAAMKYREENVPLIILAGKEYGSGSSRDWAAKGPMLQGVRAVIAESFERIHRSNLVGMGVLPLQFKAGENASSLKLTGKEVYEIRGLAQALESGFKSGRELSVVAKPREGGQLSFQVLVRIDTPQEILYYQNGGILPYVLRKLSS